MDDLFAPPGTPWQPVSPRLPAMRRLVLGLALVVLLAGWVVLTAVVGLGDGALVLGVVVVVLAAGLGWVLIGRNARLWGYAEREDDLYIRHGALFRELVAVPYGRMQYVDVTAGPLEQLFGVATVRLHTASPRSGAKIPGLPASEAARLRDRLTELGESQAAGL